MEFEGFQWDQGNRDKSRLKHGVSPEEAEQPFFHEPLVVPDAKHSTEDETRYALLGETDGGKQIFVAFTMRGSLVRVISARPMNVKERIFYAEEKRKRAL